MSKVYLAYSAPGRGKTTFALSGPGKKAYFEFDSGSYERATAAMVIPPESVVVHTISEPLTPLEDLGKLSIAMVGETGKGAVQVVHRFKGWREEYYRFIGLFLEAIKNPEYSSIIIDTSSNLWDMAQNALRQRIQEEVPPEMQGERLKRLEYEEPNAQILSMVKGAKSMNKDLILLAHEGDEWSGGKATGGLKAQGWSGSDEAATVTMRFTVENRKPVATITKAGGADLALLDMKIVEPTVQMVSDAIDGAALLRRSGMTVPSDYAQLMQTVEAMK